MKRCLLLLSVFTSAQGVKHNNPCFLGLKFEAVALEEIRRTSALLRGSFRNGFLQGSI